MKKIFQKTRSLLLALLLAMALPANASAACVTFSDIAESDACYESVMYLAEEGITNGTGSDTFSPDAPLTVRQWAAMLCRAYDLPIEGETWETLSYNAMVEAYSHGWINYSIFASPDTRMCRGALYGSAFATAGVSVYDSSLYEDGGTLIGYENLLRIAEELQLCASSADPLELVTRAETAQLLHAILTQDLTVEVPTAPVTVKNPDNINANDFLLELRKVPETILTEFNERGWTYSIDFERVAQFAEELKVSCIGVTDYSSKTIYISDARATVHEFGHFLDKVLGFPAEHERLFKAEAAGSILRDYAKTNSKEYFADCFVYWISYHDDVERMEQFKETAPQTYVYMEELSRCAWKNINR